MKRADQDREKQILEAVRGIVKTVKYYIDYISLNYKPIQIFTVKSRQCIADLRVLQERLEMFIEQVQTLRVQVEMLRVWRRHSFVKKQLNCAIEEKVQQPKPPREPNPLW